MSFRNDSRKKVLKHLDEFGSRFVIVETFVPLGEPSNASIRVRPVPEEGFPEGTRVQCSRNMRKNYPIGTRFRLHLTLRETGDGPCLYAHHDAPFEVVEARQDFAPHNSPKGR
jgi:hypothetical protein